MRVASYVELAQAIRDRSPRTGTTRAVAIDGPAGSGKSVFATSLGAHLAAPIICLDDLTPAWSGPDREAAILVESVLGPLASGERAAF